MLLCVCVGVCVSLLFCMAYGFLAAEDFNLKFEIIIMSNKKEKADVVSKKGRPQIEGSGSIPIPLLLLTNPQLSLFLFLFILGGV